MRLLVVALLALLVNCFASSSHSIDVSPALEIIEGYFHDHSIIGRDATKCSVSQPCIDGVCCNGQGYCDPHTAKRRITYYAASNIRRRACEQIWPVRLNTTGFTHIVLGFAVFDPKTFAVGMQHPDDGETYKQFLRLPDNVRKGLAIGGWEMSNEGPTRTAWSDMSSTKSNRKAFIDSLKKFLDTWKFTGIEIHWEWPGASNRGGNPADTQNQVDLVHELRECFGKDFTISVVLPAQNGYLKNMAPLKMQNVVNWFTVLTYDFHGPWDAFIDGLGPKIKPHTDLAEINSTLSLLSSASLDPAKINMGLANYGRGFTVANQTCKYYGCEFTGPSKAGSCTREDGLLSACEISRIIRERNLTPQVIYGGAGVKEISWDDQWIGYDDNDTLAAKLGLANKRCLGGTSLWAIEHDHCDGGAGGPQAPQNPAQPSLPPSAPSPAPSPVQPGLPSSAPFPVQPGRSSSAPPGFSSSAAPGSSARPAPPSIQSSIQPGLPSSASSAVQPGRPLSAPSSAVPSSSAQPSIPPPAPSSAQPGLPSTVQPGLTSSLPSGLFTQPGLPPSASISVQPDLPSSASSGTPSPVQPGVLSSPTPGSSSKPVLAPSASSLIQPGLPSSVQSGLPSSAPPSFPSSVQPGLPSSVLLSSNTQLVLLPSAPSLSQPGLPSSAQPSLPSSSPSGIPSPVQPGIPSSAPPGSSAQPGLSPSAPTSSANPAQSSLPSSIASTQGSIVPQPPNSSIGQNTSPVVPSASEHPSSKGPPSPSSAVWSNQPTSRSTSSHSDVSSSVQIPGPISPLPSLSPSPAPSLAPAPSLSPLPLPLPSLSASPSQSQPPSQSGSHSTAWTATGSTVLGSYSAFSSGPWSSITLVASISVPSSSHSGSSGTGSSAVWSGSSAGSSVTPIAPVVSSVTTIVPPASSTAGSSAVSSGSSTGPSVTAIIPVIPILPSGAPSSTTPSTQVGSSSVVGSSWAGLPSGSSQAPSWIPPPPGSSAAQSPPHSSMVISSSSPGSSPMQSSGGETATRPPTSAQGSNTPTGIVVSSKASTAPPVVIVSSTPTSSSAKPSPTATGCPDECRNLDWCNTFCKGWVFPRPIDVQPPHECLLPENINWCRAWWWGFPGNIEHHNGDPDSHSDSDPDCKPNDCVAECAIWRTVTFFMFKRPVCPCVPKKCDKDGESDSPSDSDRDDPKVKPKPTSRPKEKNPKCKLLGCGCGWMGLSFGPGCPGLEIEITSPCGLFGCNPCVFFGCPGTQPSGLIGYDGYCPGGGCEPCPPELCSRPGCTISGGCGPKPGPAPTKPPNRPDPEDCDDSKRTVITERFVWCTKGYNVSALPSSLRGTSSTMVSSLCLPMIDATVTMCGGAMPGFDTTTTQTGTKTAGSNGPACTRAPLSLDDDEGDNSPNDPFHTSKTFASNTTNMVPSKTSFSSPKTTKTSFAPPGPSLGPMDKFGRWKVKINQYMFNDYSEVNWKLYDPNGNHACEHNVHGNGMKEMKDYIQSVNRPLEHMMPFGVDMTVSNPHDVNKCVVNFSIKKEMPGCKKFNGELCRPFMTTETFTESGFFMVSVCDTECGWLNLKSLLEPSDLWCQDLNDADWEPMANGWKRIFECGWKGF